MKRIEHLIAMARRNTENEVTGVTDGIVAEDFVRYCNEANKLVRSKLVQSHSQKFVTVTTQAVTINQEYYSVPDNSFLNYNIVSVFYSDSGNADDMYPLDKKDLIERVPIKGRPSKWIPSGNGFYANPIPQSASGVFYINMVQRTRQMALRSATVSSSTFSDPTLSALTLAAYTPAGTLAQQRFDEEDYLTIVDASGNVKMQGIQYSSIDTGTGVVTLEGGSYTAPSGSSIANGDYVVKGPYASSHSQLDYEAQEAVLAFMEYFVFKRDSSNDSSEQFQTAQMFLDNLIDDFEKDKQEMYSLPITSNEYF